MDYKELDVWVQSRKLVNTVYVLTKSFPDEEKYSLISQVRRCVISIPSNIAEGCGRNSIREKIHFLHIARGSLFELETILEKVKRVKKLLNGFINYHKNL